MFAQRALASLAKSWYSSFPPHVVDTILNTDQMPDGTSGVRVEQVIALVATNSQELSRMQRQMVPPPLNLVGSTGLASPSVLTPIPGGLPSPFTIPFSARTVTPTTPTRYTSFGSQRTPLHLEQSQASFMQSAVHRSHVLPGSSSPSLGFSSARAMSTDHAPMSAPATTALDLAEGAALRRKIVTTLSQDPSRASKYCSANEYFDGLL